MALEVSVVIPARDEARAIGPCLVALAGQSIGAAALEVIVVAAGADDTAGAAQRAAANGGFGRFEVVRLAAGNKNAGLAAGCRRAGAPVVVMLDADTELAPDAVAVLAGAVAWGSERAVHGAPLPRYDTWISRYWELNRLLVKALRFDGMLSGEFVAIRRATIERIGIDELFPQLPAAKGDFLLARTLAAHGCAIAYVPEARGTTLTPWTFRGLARTMLRSRRGTLAIVSRTDAWAQAAWSALLVGGPVAALLLARRAPRIALLFFVPLLVRVLRVWRDVALLRRRGDGDHRREIASFLLLDLVGRAIKLRAFVERETGGTPPLAFRGDRPAETAAGPAAGGAAP